MTHMLMFVCAANVCRSPLMAFTFAESAAENNDRTEWMVGSRGVAVARKRELCEVAAGQIAATPAGVAFAKSHVSEQIAASELMEQDLILVASRDERSQIAQLHPPARGRTFTLLEAIALGAEDLERGELDRALRAGPADAASRMEGYAQLLNSRRGRVVLPPSRSLGRPWSPRADPQDIPDVHHENLKRHAATLKELRESIRTLHRQLGGFLAAR